MNSKTAQDIQDNIFRKMSADKRVKLGSELWKMAKELVGNKINYARIRSKTAVGKDRKNS